MRVVRYEEGKDAEIFTLVIKGTNEEGWFQSSSYGKKYLEINEEELDAVLTGKKIEAYEKEAKKPSEIFRL